MEEPKYVILVRSDMKPAVEKKTFKKYSCSPAEHLKLGPQIQRSGAQNYEDSGYTSTFEYNLHRASRTHSQHQAAFYESMTSGDSGRGNWVHFIILDKTLFEECKTILSGGTAGLEKNQEENITIAQKQEGTAWDTPIFDTKKPQIFDTAQMSVQLSLTDSRTDYEILLGGNWQLKKPEDFDKKKFDKYQEHIKTASNSIQKISDNSWEIKDESPNKRKNLEKQEESENTKKVRIENPKEQNTNTSRKF